MKELCRGASLNSNPGAYRCQGKSNTQPNMGVVRKTFSQRIKTYENNDQYKKLDTEQIIMASMAQSSFMQESERLAIEIQNQIWEVLTKQRYNRGVKQAGFQVLVGASMPNVLIETGFLSNGKEEKLLFQSRYRQKIANAIFESLLNFKNKYENPLISKN